MERYLGEISIGMTISNTLKIKLRQPTSGDGLKVHALIQQCPPLDTNSVYCNLLQCHHFAETSVLAESDDTSEGNSESNPENNVVGFSSGYLPPKSPDTLFIWQIAISSPARGQGLALDMLQQLLQRSACTNVRYIHTTITANNEASWALFRKLAKQLSADITQETLFESEQHFGAQHESELLVIIGPLKRSLVASSSKTNEE